MTDEYDNRSVESLLRDLIANQHSLYEDIQDIHEKLTRLEERLEQVYVRGAEDAAVQEGKTTPTETSGGDDDFFQTVDLRADDSELAQDPAAAPSVAVRADESTTTTKEAVVDETAADLEPDNLYEDAEALVIEEGKATQALLQQHLHISPTRAKHLLALLEAEGVVGPHRVGKSRKVFITYAAD